MSLMTMTLYGCHFTFLFTRSVKYYGELFLCESDSLSTSVTGFTAFS